MVIRARITSTMSPAPNASDRKALSGPAPLLESRPGDPRCGVVELVGQVEGGHAVLSGRGGRSGRTRVGARRGRAVRARARHGADGQPTVISSIWAMAWVGQLLGQRSVEEALGLFLAGGEDVVQVRLEDVGRGLVGLDLCRPASTSAT